MTILVPQTAISGVQAATGRTQQTAMYRASSETIAYAKSSYPYKKNKIILFYIFFFFQSVT